MMLNRNIPSPLHGDNDLRTTFKLKSQQGTPTPPTPFTFTLERANAGHVWTWHSVGHLTVRHCGRVECQICATTTPTPTGDSNG